ncbi:MAG: hypothetical protein HY804_03025, partial [Nitrospinae bacterium]|nr:hypothetical protein [Nitrospinota bacterium]
MTSLFKRNLAALAPREPDLARRLSGVAPAPDKGAAPASGASELIPEVAR